MPKLASSTVGERQDSGGNPPSAECAVESVGRTRTDFKEGLSGVAAQGRILVNSTREECNTGVKRPWLMGR